MLPGRGEVAGMVTLKDLKPGKDTLEQVTLLGLDTSKSVVQTITDLCTDERYGDEIKLERILSLSYAAFRILEDMGEALSRYDQYLRELERTGDAAGKAPSRPHEGYETIEG
jgi:hypothetical protein